MCKEEIKVKKCPYCGGENFEHMGENDYWNGMPWHCHECDNWFNEDDYLHQLYWENISCMLNGTSEEEPFILSTHFILPSVEKESYIKLRERAKCGTTLKERPILTTIGMICMNSALRT